LSHFGAKIFLPVSDDDIPETIIVNKLVSKNNFFLRKSTKIENSAENSSGILSQCKKVDTMTEKSTTFGHAKTSITPQVCDQIPKI